MQNPSRVGLKCCVRNQSHGTGSKVRARAVAGTRGFGDFVPRRDRREAVAAALADGVDLVTAHADERCYGGTKSLPPSERGVGATNEIAARGGRGGSGRGRAGR